MERVRIERQGEAEKLDLLWGGRAIADFIGVPLHKFHYMVRNGELPVRRMGERLYASKAQLKAFFHSN